MTFNDGVGHSGGDQLDSADSIIVAGNNIVNLIRIAVGIYDSDNGDAQLVRFSNSDLLLAGIDNEHSSGQLVHILNAAEVFLELLDLEFQLNNFLLRQTLKSAVCFHLAQLLQTTDTLTDGFKVGEHTAQPTSVYIVSTGALRFLTDGIASLLLGTNKENGATVGGKLTNEIISLFQLLYGLLQVDDVDTVALGEDVLSHLGIPATGLVTKVYASFQKLFHRYYCHCLFTSKNLFV